MVAFATSAHAPVATRTLRLQLEDGRLQGLLTFHLPPAAARVYAASKDPAVALVPRALAGLNLSSDGAALQPRVSDARVRTQPSGALDALILVDASFVQNSLTVSVDAEPPLPVEVLARTGTKLHLDDGPGAPVRGGLLLHPRPGLPCTISISAAGSPDTRR